MENRIYRKAVGGGVMSLVCGIIAIVSGVATGVLLIVSGGSLIFEGRKNHK